MSIFCCFALLGLLSFPIAHTHTHTLLRRRDCERVGRGADGNNYEMIVWLMVNEIFVTGNAIERPVLSFLSTYYSRVSATRSSHRDMHLAGGVGAYVFDLILGVRRAVVFKCLLHLPKGLGEGFKCSLQFPKSRRQTTINIGLFFWNRNCLFVRK